MCSDSRLRSFVSCRARRHPHLTVLARQLDGGSRGRAAAAATTAMGSSMGGSMGGGGSGMAGGDSRLLSEAAPSPAPPSPPQAAASSLRACELAGSVDPVTTREIAGKARTLLSTPKVVATARRHYGCTCGEAGAAASASCLDGVPLEDCLGGADCSTGTGTAGSHWEKRIAHGEIMTGTAGASAHRSPISDLTLAVFEDAGWYQPVYTVGEPLCEYEPSWCAAALGSLFGQQPGLGDTQAC